MPSMRKRICRRFSCGSMWMSEAPTWIASSNTDCSSLTTGASSAPSAGAERAEVDQAALAQVLLELLARGR